ncbi:MAG: FdtA/QdtA family cupin domain-containing protein [Pseudomonadota bacterium]
MNLDAPIGPVALPPVATLIEPATFSTPDGEIRIVEFARLPWTPKRRFWITGVGPDVVRGQHAHHQCWQFFEAPSGCASLHIETPDGRRFAYNLHAGSASVLVPPRRWVEVRMASPEAVLYCLASHPFDRGDYVADRAAFQALAP